MSIKFDEFIKNAGIDIADAERAKEKIYDSKYRFLLGKDSNGDAVIEGNTDAIRNNSGQYGNRNREVYGFYKPEWIVVWFKR